MNNVEYKINDPTTLDDAISISREIFSPSAKEIEEYHNKQDWNNKIEKGGLLVVVYIENEPAAFVLSHIKEANSLHIWVGGVLKKFRGLGLWSGLYEKIEKYAKDKSFEKLTLNTYRDKFPIMYNFATKHGFTCYKTEMKDGLEKSFFEMSLGGKKF
jgi:GNAT superfamily N-acetyltransferase